MSIKRRDKKGRILRNGESQRKDGRYQFDYIDAFGKSKCFYSWKLETTDPLPTGRRPCIALREKEKDLQRDILNGIALYGDNLTVLDIVQKYVSQKQGVRESTKRGYQTVINTIKNDVFGTVRIDKVKPSDAKAWLIYLQKECGKSYSTIHTIRGVLRPAFRMAVEDDLIRKNPFDFELVTVVVNDSETRDAITHKQKRQFLEFVQTDKHFCKYYDVIYILFYTGMRISEFCGLTESDIDFENKTISIERQLQRTSDMRYIIEPPKTEAGIRKLPMTDEVCACFKRIIENRPKIKCEPTITDTHNRIYAGFLCLDRNQMPMVALHWEKYFQRICNKYNSIYKKQMPPVTPHVCRHTYCTHNAHAGMNPKNLQYLMGHADINVTLNVYTHVDFDDVCREVSKIKKAVL